MLEQHVLVDGDSNCKHKYVIYARNRKEGQYWECDNQQCGRKIWVNSTTHLIIRFPPDAFVRFQSTQSDVYRYQADEKGIAREELEPRDRIHKKDIEASL